MVTCFIANFLFLGLK